MDESMTRQLESMRMAYARLLDDHSIDSYEDSMSVLEKPLCNLWASAYEAGCANDTFLELLRYRRSHFLHDSSCTVGIDAECRVVAALTVSQEILPMAELIDRLEAEYHKGRVTEETLDSIDSSLIAISEGLTRREAEKFRQALGLTTQMHLQPLSPKVEQFVKSVKFWSPPSMARQAVRDVLDALNAGLTLLDQPAIEFKSRKGIVAEDETLECMSTSAAIIEARLPSEKISEISSTLLRYMPSTKEFKRNLQNPSEEFLQRIREHILPIVSGRHDRPRHLSGPRRHRIKGGRYDVGHFIAHSSGGPPDINLFQQDRSLNRGWSRQGKSYRLMEEYPANNPGTFYFSRAIYGDSSSLPRVIELGILLPKAAVDKIADRVEQEDNMFVLFPESATKALELAWWIGVFDNCPSKDKDLS